MKDNIPNNTKNVQNNDIMLFPIKKNINILKNGDELGQKIYMIN